VPDKMGNSMGVSPSIVRVALRSVILIPQDFWCQGDMKKRLAIIVAWSKLST
jgi:hypothetical protein